MPNMFRRATKDAAKVRLGIDGPSGSGKTWTSLMVAAYFAKQANGTFAVIDTENGSASKYVGETYNSDGDQFDFDTVTLSNFHPERYIEAIHAAEDEGYVALVIDSASHAWSGKGGVLELHDQAAAKAKSGNSYVAWRDVTPVHNKLVDALVQCKIHLIVTLRSKTEYVQERDSEGKTVIRRVGMSPIQRDGLEYEFDVMGSMDVQNRMMIVKTRCSALNGAFLDPPNERNLALVLSDWVSSGRSVEDRTRQAIADYQQVFERARDMGISTAKPLAEDMGAPQIERWTTLLQKKIDDIERKKAEPVD